MRWFRRRRDELAAVVIAAVFALEMVGLDAPHKERLVAAAVVAGLALAARRRLPLACFLVCWGALAATVVTAPGLADESVGFLVAYLLAHYSLGRWAVGREAWAAAVAVLGSMVAFGLGDAEAQGHSWTQIDLGSIAFTIGFVAGPWAAGLVIRLRRDREVGLDAENLKLRDEQETVARRAVAEERARIARELHDVVSHAISVTVLQARGARRVLGEGRDDVRGALDAIEMTNTQALGDMRRLLAVLRDTDGDFPTTPQPSLARLDALLDDVRRSGLRVELETTGERTDVPPGVDLSAYRIVQEALTNVLKHAGPARARVVLDFRPDALDVTVRDTGRGPSEHNGRGHGLIGIRERVAMVGGDVTAGPAAGGGFEVSARLPYATEVS